MRSATESSPSRMRSRRASAAILASATRAGARLVPPSRSTNCASSTRPKRPRLISSLYWNRGASGVRREAERPTAAFVISSEQHHRFAFPALFIGSCALAFGPWLVRLSGVGPVATGFWRLSLALPFLFAIAAVTGQPVHWPGRRLASLVAFAAFFFAADLAVWHAGIHITKLGNAPPFGNSSSLIFALWGLWIARQRPSLIQAGALALAAIGAAMLMG